ncbi:helix-turn-helix transcriptional regulator [Petroclostridium sp. X23]|uniref:helix-turn-helix domain-containing protein n=1 Tax=Petroclostridium sp. X23 TaxID=3045146 RepID=UPI0024ACB464|nr:helix-turn-helix transcriptional regulator [Petroclostridium sp. X23]WHH57197.1 helix-turn-helix transcriptional regulator [Petroclostridium sp. X23]
MAEKLGEYLQGYRMQADYTLRRLGEIIGVDHSYLGKIETGKKKPSKEVLDKLISILGIDETEVLRLMGQHVETTGVKLEKENPEGVDILYKLTKSLDDEGRTILNNILIQVKLGLDGDNVDAQKIAESLAKLKNNTKMVDEG